jgi:hypothetical protein
MVQHTDTRTVQSCDLQVLGVLAVYIYTLE